MFSRNVSMDLKLDTLRKSTQMFEADIRLEHCDSSSITTARELEGRRVQCTRFLGECWQRMRRMKADFERSQ